MWQTALILGFAGSMHCMGMCAPLVLAATNLKPSAFINRVIYNTGRVATYALLGGMVASAGMILPINRFQNVLSIVFGVLLVLIGLGMFDTQRLSGVTQVALKVTSRLKTSFGVHLQRKTRLSMFVLGALNGLLPCGLTMIALTWCLTLKGPLDGINFMLLFGAGTLPVMLGIAGWLPTVARRLRWNMQSLTTSMFIASGSLLIVRVFVTHAPHTQSGNIMDIIMCR